MSTKPYILPQEWTGFYFEGEYLVDEYGNKNHILEVKALPFTKQMKLQRDLIFKRPEWDD